MFNTGDKVIYKEPERYNPVTGEYDPGYYDMLKDNKVYTVSYVFGEGKWLDLKYKPGYSFQSRYFELSLKEQRKEKLKKLNNK